MYTEEAKEIVYAPSLVVAVSVVLDVGSLDQATCRVPLA